ncbi:50S ribosomal protein L13 [Moorella sp. Hama-1]|uniref:50S ribosomal protein L13 n=1 Tax=Moorella sp. Hama-1 TaxID=2138101 RepID=UPI000D657BDA|nr:50S ribosomal protein L13 [Moorella sp. Hama-1]MDN5362650.1 large subunit ribosomal protein [Moorella sp. (in: firmicutes)]BCV23110.1 50S ribosomal protein L13 [Moorella sp. Hama-1]
MSTFMAKPQEVERKWYVINADGKTLGRVATEAARLLRGKHKPTFTPHVDTGDHVIIINAEKVRLTGNKLQKKQYIRYTGYPGGLKVMNYATLLKTFPERAIEKAVKGMIPHNSLGRKMVKKLKVYRGNNHPHTAQKPEVWEIKD